MNKLIILHTFVVLYKNGINAVNMPKTIYYKNVLGTNFVQTCR